MTTRTHEPEGAGAIDFAEIVQWLGHYVICVDLKTRRIVYASLGAAGRLGAEGGLELRGPTLDQLLTKLFPDAATHARMVRLLDGDVGGEPIFEYRSGESGPPRWRRATVRVLRDAAGAPERLDVLSTDVTELVECRRATARSETLRRIGERVYRAAHVVDVVDAVCAEVRDALGVSRCALYLFDDGAGVVNETGVHGGAVIPGAPRWTREMLTRPLAKHGRVAQFRDIALVDDVPHREHLLDQGVRSLATVGIGSLAQPLGLLAVSTVGQERVFEPEEMKLLEDVANVIGAPLARAALLQEKQRAEALLAEAEERSRAGLEATETGIWELDPTTGRRTWDARCYEIWEVDRATSPDDLEAERYIHPDDLAGVLAAWRHARDPATDGRFSIEHRYTGPSGRLKWIAAHGRCFFTPDGQPRRFIGTIVDVTARHRAEAERIEAERRYREIVETMTEGVGVLDAMGHVTFANHAYAEMFGYEDEAALVGMHVEELMFPEDRIPERERWMAHLAAGGGPVRHVRRFRAKDGQELSISTASVPLFEDGVFTGILGVLTDVTAAMRLEAKLQQAQKLESLGVLAGGIAHDFNNLLVGMLGNAGLARAEVAPGSNAHASISSIETAAVRASELTRQLLAYAGKGRFVLGRIDLRRLVEEMGHLLATVIGKGVVLRYRFGEGSPALEGDATQLRQVVMNLITNASDAVGERGGTITVTTGVVEIDDAPLVDAVLDDALPPGRYAFLEVTDTGVGMSPETRARVFDPFFTTKFTGRGLGLAAVLGIVRGHHGGIAVTSAIGRGTTFRLLFPAVVPEVVVVAPAAPEPTSPVEGQRATVLVVDDEEIVRKVVTRMLTRAGYDVIAAADGVEAVGLYREHRSAIRAVVLDETMPRMSGRETLQQLREIDPDVQVLLSSGYTEDEMTAQFAGTGVAAFLAKPFTPEALIDRVSALVAARAMR